MKLKAKDEKLLAYVYHHYREPFTVIGKACRISRNQVEYALNKLQKGGLIKKYLTVFNYSLMGYNEFVIVWLKIKNNSKAQIRKELEDMKNVVSTGNVLNKYDIFVNFVFKDIVEFESVFFDFIEKHKDKIMDYSFFRSTFVEFFPLKFFGDEKEEASFVTSSENKMMETITDKDLKIIKMLEEDGRSRIVDIAKKTGISSELIVYRIKQMYKKNLIVGIRIQFDMEKLGFYFASLRLKIDATKELKKELEQFCIRHKYINALSFGLADYNCIIQFFYQNEADLRKSVQETNEFIGDKILDSDLLLIEKEGKCKTLPY